MTNAQTDDEREEEKVKDVKTGNIGFPQISLFFHSVPQLSLYPLCHYQIFILDKSAI